MATSITTTAALLEITWDLLYIHASTLHWITQLGDPWLASFPTEKGSSVCYNTACCSPKTNGFLPNFSIMKDSLSY